MLHMAPPRLLLFFFLLPHSHLPLLPSPCFLPISPLLPPCHLVFFSLPPPSLLPISPVSSPLHGVVSQVVRLCRGCLEKQEGVLADTHLLRLRVLSVAGEVLSFLHCFSEAADYAGRMVEGYMKLYHHNNAQLGMAIMRAGVTQWHAGKIEVGHGMICKAYGILMVTHGPNHPITRDLESMRLQAETELKMFQKDECVYRSMRDAALNKQLVISSS